MTNIPLRYTQTPCDECPWRRDVPVGRFPPNRFRMLVATARDMARRTFACHKSKDGHEFVCAGFLLQQSAHNFTIRMALRDQGDFIKDIHSPWPLFTNYREMAIANGIKPDAHCLKGIRDDGQYHQSGATGEHRRKNRETQNKS